MFVAADLLPLDDRPREDSYILTTTLSPSQMIFFNVINNKKKKWTEKNEYLQTEKKNLRKYWPPSLQLAPYDIMNLKEEEITIFG